LFGEQQVSGLNANAAEAALILLILRDLQRLKAYVREQLFDEEHSDARVTALLGRGEIEPDEAIAIILNTTVCRALAFFDFALQTGDESLLEATRGFLADATKVADEAAWVPLWWIVRLCGSIEPAPRVDEVKLTSSSR
jgi:hypothetical protein